MTTTGPTGDTGDGSDDGIGPATARALRHRLAVAQRDGRVPSIVAAVARRGGPVFTGVAGTLDGSTTGTVPGPDVQYRIGSITKTVVAVCVLRLVEAGDVDLDDPIGRHLPDSPVPSATVRQLLTHTAGIASETPPPWWERTDGSSRPDLVDVLPDPPLRHRPGHTFHYSNPGYGLLAALVGAVSGRPWFEVARDHVLAPLGMTRTDYLPTAPHASGWAVHPWADLLLPEPAHDHGLLAGAGQLWSTPSDLCRFGTFLAGGSDGAGGPDGAILGHETLSLMRTPASGAEGTTWTGGYGLGIQLFRFGDHVLFGHSGSMPGFLAMLVCSANDGLTVAVQANAWARLPLGELAADLLAIVRDREPTMPEPWTPAVTVDEAAFALVGPWYWGAQPVSITLRADGDLDLAGLGGRGRAARFAVVDGRWTGRDGYYAGEYLVPQRSPDGTITHLDLGSFVFTRAPYGPGGVVPGGLDGGDWQPLPGRSDGARPTRATDRCDQ